MSDDSEKKPFGNEIETRDFSKDEFSLDADSSLDSIRIGRYEIQRQLGKGGFGFVLLAYDPSLKRQVAIKVPRWDKRLPETAVERFLREGQMLAKANHPSIVSVYDVGLSVDQIPFVVMEYVKGVPLSTMLKKRRYSMEESIELLIQIGEGLQQAHKRGLVHRDFKPANVILTEEQEICLVDFGLALHEELSPDEWESGSILGTPSFMAPEQVRGENHLIDGQTDIWAFGVTMYLVFTGKLPFHGQFRELSRAICYKNPRPLRQLDETIPKPLERICLRCIRKLMDERYQSMADVLEELIAFDTERRQLQANRQSGVPESLSGLIDATPGPNASSTGPSSRSAGPRHATSTGRTDSQGSAVSLGEKLAIVPKGLRAFDQNDRDFFLSMIPGPRDRHGVPESVRFWISRLGIHDQVDDVPIGLIFGPSGCGKSSFTRAGLIPCLPEHVVPIYVDCTTEDLPKRIVSKIHQEIHDVPADGKLAKILRAVRLGDYIRPNDKLLLILDQFEQWISSCGNYADNELTEALRQCESQRVQTLLLVRDEFWMSTSQFLRCLNHRIDENHNAMSLPLLDERDSRRVLEAIGRAYGNLPADGSSLTSQQSRFLQEAVKSLSQRGKVICVHLAVFAETAKSRDWIYSELKSVGGWEGVGREFITDIFSNPGTPSYVRRHSTEAWRILELLLPKTDTELKGPAVGRESLKRGAGLQNQSSLFDELLHFLEFEAILISPVEDQSSFEDESPGEVPSLVERKQYGLTHDFLVKPIRDWGAAKQNETRQGRADSLVNNLAGQWRLTKDDRFLLSIYDYFRASLFASSVAKNKNPGYWKSTKRRAIRRLSTVSVVAAILLVAGFYLWQQNSRNRVKSVVNRYLEGGPVELADRRKELEAVFDQVETELIRETRSDQLTRRVRARAMLFKNSPGDEQQLAGILADITEIPRQELPNLIASLSGASSEIVPIIAGKYQQNGNVEARCRLAILAAYLQDHSILSESLELRQNPELRTKTIQQIADWHALPSKLIRPIAGQIEGLDGNHLSGIVTGLGLMDATGLKPSEKQFCIEFFENVYRKSPDAGAHTAAVHAISIWGSRLPEIDEQKPADRRWLELAINSQFGRDRMHDLLLVEIPAGSYVPASGVSDDFPLLQPELHTGTVDTPFWISAFEVSADLLEEFEMDRQQEESSASMPASGDWAARYDYEVARHVDHSTALEFCNWLNESVTLELSAFHLARLNVQSVSELEFQLPTCDQFEFANRCYSTTKFFFGSDRDDLPTFAWRDEFIANQVPPNGFGVSDLMANVEEWIAAIDQFDFATVKGGSDGCSEDQLASAYNVAIPAATKSANRGFRVVLQKKRIVNGNDPLN